MYAYRGAPEVYKKRDYDARQHKTNLRQKRVRFEEPADAPGEAKRARVEGPAVEALTVAPEVGEAGPSSAAPGTRAAPRAARGKQRRYAPPLVEEAPDKELPQVPAMPENTLVYRRPFAVLVKLDAALQPPIHQRVLRHGWYLR